MVRNYTRAERRYLRRAKSSYVSPNSEAKKRKVRG